MFDISIIIPLYNEQNNVIPLYERITKNVSEITNLYEIIFINDGSCDNTFDIISDISNNDTKVKYINLSRNFGQQKAISAGLDYCTGNSVIIMDGDLQDPPELISELYKKYSEGFDVVYAKRLVREGESWLKLTTAWYFYRVII